MALTPYEKRKNSLKIALTPYEKCKNSLKRAFPRLGRRENGEKQLSQDWETKKMGKYSFPKVGK